jgi:hypothetical protein
MSNAQHLTLRWVEGYTPDDRDNNITQEEFIYDHHFWIVAWELERSIVIDCNEFQYELMKKIFQT